MSVRTDAEACEKYIRGKVLHVNELLHETEGCGDECLGSDQLASNSKS